MKNTSISPKWVSYEGIVLTNFEENIKLIIMKKILLIVLLITLNSISYSQNPRLAFSSKNIATYKQATTMVMLKENDVYSKILKKVINDNWTFNKYEFTTEEKLKSKYKEKASLPMLGFFKGYLDYVGSNESYTTTGIQSIGFVTVFKTEKNYNLNNKEVVHAFKLDNLKELKSDSAIEASLTVMIQDLNNYLIVLGTPESKVKSRKAYWNYINKKNLKNFKNKKILISEDEVKEKFKLDISSAKKYNYEVVSQARITKAILGKEDILIYYPYYDYISRAKNGELLAIIRSNTPILFKDFRNR